MKALALGLVLLSTTSVFANTSIHKKLCKAVATDAYYGKHISYEDCLSETNPRTDYEGNTEISFYVCEASLYVTFTYDHTDKKIYDGSSGGSCD